MAGPSCTEYLCHFCLHSNTDVQALRHRQQTATSPTSKIKNEVRRRKCRVVFITCQLIDLLLIVQPKLQAIKCVLPLGNKRSPGVTRDHVKINGRHLSHTHTHTHTQTHTHNTCFVRMACKRMHNVVMDTLC